MLYLRLQQPTVGFDSDIDGDSSHCRLSYSFALHLRLGKGNPAFHYEVFSLLELGGEMALYQRVHTESSQAGTHANIN